MALQFDQLQASQTANPPQFGQQGQVLPTLGSGTPAGDMSTMRGATANTGGAGSTGGLGGQDQSVQFGLALQNLLKQSQQLGTKSFVNQGLNASDAQQGAISASTPQSLIGASPGQQDSVRSNQASIFSPLIQGANSAAQTFGEQLGGFKDAVSSAQNFMQSYQQQQQQSKTNAQNIIHDAVAGGSEALTALIKTQPDIIKLAGYTPDTLQGVVSGLQKNEQQKADSLKTTSTVDLGNQIAVVDNQGNVIKYLPKGQNPGTHTDTGFTGPIDPSNYVAGANPTVDSWVKLISSDPSNYSIKDVPDSAKDHTLINAVSAGLASVGSTPQVNELKQTALSSAQNLLNELSGAPVGGNRLLGGAILSRLPGTKSTKFVTDFNNLKSLLSLDNVKLLKGQGAVSDAERQLLADASSRLSLNLSNADFKSALDNVVKGLSGSVNSSSGTTQPPSFQLPNGSVVHLQTDGTYK